MSLIGKKVNEFKTMAYHNGEFKEITSENLKGKWNVFVFYPADFTFVCPTELEDLAEHYEKFKAEGCEVYSVSTDTHFVHKAWHDTSERINKIKFPMLADPTGKLSRDFEVMIEEEGLALRGSFVINPEGTIVAYEVHDTGIGREASELLRKLQAAKFVAEHGEVCPAKWRPGSETIKPSIDLVGKTVILCNKEWDSYGEKIYDLVVIGGGPAGLTAGIYAGRAMLDVLVIEKDRAGGQITLTNEIVNYPGILETNGEKFGEDLKKQALGFGVNFINDEVIGMDLSKDIKIIKTKTEEYQTLSVVIATGAAPRKLGFKGEKEFTGRGVAYCATCDGEFFTGLDVFVIGAGFAAAEEAVFLTKYARKVTVIAREPEFTCAKSIAEKVLKNPKIEVKFNSEILEAEGDTQLKRALFKNNVTNEIFEYNAEEGKTFGIFVFVGYEPQSRLFEGHVALDNYGYVSTDEDLMTNIPGVYAVGDIRPKKLKQVVTAVADGADAAMSIEKYTISLREKLGLKKEEKREEEKSSKFFESHGEFLDSSLKEQLAAVTEKFENEIEIVLIKDFSNEKSLEMERAFRDISSVSEKIKFSSYEKGENPELEQKINAERFPTSAILNKNGEFSGIKYSTVPGGHELNSFILAMYNTAGPGQKISDETLEKIRNIKRPINVKIGISLSCSNCPETVQSVQRIAAENKNIQVEVIDVLTFRDFKDKHEIMSVPAMVVNDRGIFFGRKNIDEVLHFL